jgi:uncharacterized membrane protein
MMMTHWQALNELLHLASLALWLGGMVFFLVVFGPAVNELHAGIGVRALNQGRVSFEVVSWSAIGLLSITGAISLALRDPDAPQGEFYTIILVVKLLLFFAMLVHHGLQAFRCAPQISLLTGQTSADAPAWPEPLRAQWRKWFTLLKINAALAPIAVLLGMALGKN